MVFCSCFRSKERKTDFVSAFDDGIDPTHIPKKANALFFIPCFEKKPCDTHSKYNTERTEPLCSF